MRFRILRMLRHGTSACAWVNSAQPSITFVAASPMTIRLMMTACWVRLSAKKSSLAIPSTKPRASVAACWMWSRKSGRRFRSYRLRLREHLDPELRRQVAGGQQIDVNAEQRFQFFFQIAQVQQRGSGQRINQQIEVAAIPVGAIQHRTEDARVRRAEAAYRFTHRASLHVKHNRRSHGNPFLSKLVEIVCNQECSFKDYFRESQCLDFPCRAGCLGGLVTNLRFQEEGNRIPRRSILSTAERESLLALPDTKDDLIRHYTFSESDLSIIRQRRGPATRLGFAVHLCYLRFPGVILGVDEPPFPPLLRLLANQIKVGVESWDEYGQREQTRREHLVELQTVFGFQPFTMGHYRQAVQLLAELALQTDKGIVLASALIEHLRRQSGILPALHAVERASAEADPPHQPAHLRCLGRTAVGRASPPPRRSAQAPRQRQDDLVGLAAPVTGQAEPAEHAGTHRTPQGVAGARSAFRHRAAGSPKPAAQDRPRGRPDDACRPG